MAIATSGASGPVSSEPGPPSSAGPGSAGPQANGLASPRTSVVRLRDRWDILVDMPLGDLRAPTALAYAVEDQRSVGTSFFALIADPKQPIRGAALNLVRMAKTGHVLTPVEHGTVDWPPARQRCLA